MQMHMVIMHVLVGGSEMCRHKYHHLGALNQVTLVAVIFCTLFIMVNIHYLSLQDLCL